MRELGGVSINFPKEKTGAKANVVVIRGPKDDVAKAKARLEELATNEVCWGVSSDGRGRCFVLIALLTTPHHTTPHHTATNPATHLTLAGAQPSH